MPGASRQDLTDVSNVLLRLKDTIGRELHDYPYPIAGCDEVFKTLVHQKECCRIALAGFAVRDGITTDDALVAIRDLLATPVALAPDERALLEGLALKIAAVAPMIGRPSPLR